jgi:translation initiation factor IF-2
VSSNSVRVYELAKEVGLENRDVIRRLTELGVEAKSHSSSVSVVDAKRLKDSIGRSAEERQQEESERKRREQAELERYRKVEQQAATTKRKAAKVLPPHLREQQAEAVADASPAPATEVAPDAPAKAVAPAATADGGAPDHAAPAATSATGEDEDGDASTPKRMPGAPPRMRPVDAPLRPPVPGAPAPAVPGPASPTEGLTVRRARPDSSLPQEGSGRRMIPPPLREARPRPAGAGAPGAGAGAPVRGRPGPGAGAPSSPYRQTPGRAAPGAGAPRTGPGAAPGGPARGPGAGLGGPGSGKTRKKKRRDRETPEEQELRGPMRRDIPLEQQVTSDRIEVVSGITVGEIADKLGVAGSALV